MKKPQFKKYDLKRYLDYINSIKKYASPDIKDKLIDLIILEVLFYRKFVIKEKFKSERFMCKHLDSCLKNPNSKCFANQDPETTSGKIKFSVFLIIDFFKKKQNREKNKKYAKSCFENVLKYRNNNC